jgi:hypothetical protein
MRRNASATPRMLVVLCLATAGTASVETTAIMFSYARPSALHAEAAHRWCKAPCAPASRQVRQVLLGEDAQPSAAAACTRRRGHGAAVGKSLSEVRSANNR